MWCPETNVLELQLFLHEEIKGRAAFRVSYLCLFGHFHLFNSSATVLGMHKNSWPDFFTQVQPMRLPLPTSPSNSSAASDIASRFPLALHSLPAQFQWKLQSAPEPNLYPEFLQPAWHILPWYKHDATDIPTTMYIHTNSSPSHSHVRSHGLHLQCLQHCIA